MDADKIREEFGHRGKPKQWQIGFDALLRHMPDYVKEANRDESELNDRVIKPDGKKETETGPDENGCNYGAQGGWCDAPDDYECTAKMETNKGNGCLEAL